MNDEWRQASHTRPEVTPRPCAVPLYHDTVPYLQTTTLFLTSRPRHCSLPPDHDIVPYLQTTTLFLISRPRHFSLPLDHDTVPYLQTTTLSAWSNERGLNVTVDCAFYAAVARKTGADRISSDINLVAGFSNIIVRPDIPIGTTFTTETGS